MDVRNKIVVQNKWYYETEQLRGKQCLVCGQDFRYKINKNKSVFRKKDFVYYTIVQDPTIHFVHDNCLTYFFKENYKDRQIVLNHAPVLRIERMNRLGEKMYQKNYVKDARKFLTKYYTQLFYNDSRLSRCFEMKRHFFSWQCASYKFKESERPYFLSLLQEYNSKYQHKGIILKIAPEIVAVYLSNNH